MKTAPTDVSFAPCSIADFETMHAMRLESMRESLERLRRYDPKRSRQRLERSFYPDLSQFILLNGERIGFYTFRPATDGFHLEHFYLLPQFHGRGIGTAILQELTARADQASLPIFLGALKESPVNRFYQRHGFVKDNESEWDIYYIRQPQSQLAEIR